MSKKIELNIKTEDGYEVLYPKTDSSNNVVNTEILNKFGLTEGSNVGDVLNELGKYNEYWWEEITPAHNEYSVISEELSGDLTQDNIYYSTGNGYGYNTYFYYSDSYYISNNEELLLNNPIIMPHFSNEELLVEYVNTNLKGKYIKVKNSSNYGFYYFPEDIVCGQDNQNGLKVWYENNDDSDSYYVLSIMYKKYSNDTVLAKYMRLKKEIIPQKTLYVYSANINQYLHDQFENYEIQKDYEYNGTDELILGTTTNTLVQISSGVEIVNNKIQLKQPITEISVSTGSSGVTNLNANALGKYMIPRMPHTASTAYSYPKMITEICYIPENAVFKYSSSKFYLTKAISLKIVGKGKYYKFLGKPFENCKKIGNIELLGEFNLPTTYQDSQKTYLLNIKSDSNYLYYLDYKLDVSFSLNTDSVTLFKNKGLTVDLQDNNDKVFLTLFSSSTTQNTSDNEELPLRYQINTQYYMMLYPFSNTYDLHSQYSNMACQSFPSFYSSATNHTEEIYININNTLKSNNKILLNYEKEHSIKICRVKLFDF